MSNAIELTVSELSGALKRMVEDAFGSVRLRGEISGYRGPHSSGHAYFALKDDKARIEAVIWRGVMSKLRFKPEEGLEVIASGKLTTYPGSSKYQIVIEALEPAGVGALMALIEERRQRLAEEGLFDNARKKPLPFMPRVVGVVTSPTGAVIRDILHRLTSRFPLHVIVWPVRVQGEGCGEEVAGAIEGFNGLAEKGPEGGLAIPSPDVLIVARGGGSLEDLWGFHDEAVVRAVAASRLPVVSAIGHETDWTLIDHAADIRAPTPTAAAEMAVPVRLELEASLSALHARLCVAINRHVEEWQNRLRVASRLLPHTDQLFASPRQRFDEATARLALALVHGVEKKHNHFNLHAVRLSWRPIGRVITQHHQRLLEQGARANRSLLRLVEQKQHLLKQSVRLLKTVNYKNILARGFVLVLDEKKQPIKQAARLHKGNTVTLRFVDGDVVVRADNTTKRETHLPQQQIKKPDKNLPKNPQGNLF